MKILAIETSCDETACAVVENGTEILASSLATSAKLHEKTGGIVPEVAARKQLDFVVPVINDTLEKFCTGEGLSLEKVLKFGCGVDAVAVTTGPGLMRSLVVGIEAAKALSFAWDKPLIPVNHLIGHIYANFVGETACAVGANGTIEFPAVALVVSGGHTDLVLMKNHGDFEYLGGTLDDAAGEAFDKTARLIGLSKYLGGAALSKKAAECKENTLAGVLPRPMLNENNYDFSFSGLKTAVKRLVAKSVDETGAVTNPAYSTECLAREFETAVVDVLTSKTIKAAKEFKVKSILLGGGVAANSALRTRLQKDAQKINIPVFVPPISLCGDNAVAIASAAFFNQVYKKPTEVVASPSLGIMGKA